MLKVKRLKSEVECDVCGRRFMQTRWWQVYCSAKCRKELEKTAKSTLKTVLPELEYLRKRVRELERNALVHSAEQDRFRYDDENQELT